MEAAVNRHRPFKILAPFALILVLGACAGDAQTRAVAGLAIACETFRTAVEQATPYVADGSLSDANVARIVAARQIADPACAPGSTVDPAQYVGIVQGLTDQIAAIVKGN
jgi:hypothetical protein